MSDSVSKTNRGTSAVILPPQDQVTLADVARLVRELKGGLEDVLATLRARRKPMYTVEEIAELTGRAPYTVRRWVSEKKIKAIRISGTGPRGRLLIPSEELTALIGAGIGTNVPEVALD